MPITHDMVAAAQGLVTETQARVFFNKLASYGITPSDDNQAGQLWALADEILKERPRLSQAGMQMKQASFDAFGDEHVSRLTDDGCSETAHALADQLIQEDPTLVKAAHLLLSINNA